MQTREITVWAHSYIKNIKARYLEHCKATLPEDNGFILKSRDCWKVPFHYARRYSTLEQQPSKTPYLFVIYIHKKSTKSYSFKCLSDHTKHDLNAVHTSLEKVSDVLKVKYATLQKCFYFIDGTGSQYKNYIVFSNYCHHESDSGLSAEWNFFATSHGKSPCDGIGGTVKCLVSIGSLQSSQESIDTPLRLNLYLFPITKQRFILWIMV